MNALILLIKEIVSPISNLLWQISKRDQGKTDRILALLKETENKSETLEHFLKEELHRKISIELKGVEFTEAQLKIIEREISNTGDKIKWFHIKEAKQYLFFEGERLKINFYFTDRLFNIIGFVLGMIFMTMGLAVIFMDFFTNIDGNNVYVMSIQVTYFLIMITTGSAILNGTGPYFSAARIKREINQTMSVN